ncbi:hypothetical protein JCM8208_002490 [Rhodotorula glutinis]
MPAHSPTRRTPPPLVFATPASPPAAPDPRAPRPARPSEQQPRAGATSMHPRGSRTSSPERAPPAASSRSSSPTRARLGSLSHPQPAEHSYGDIEHLADLPPDAPPAQHDLSQERRPSVLGFIEPARPSSHRGRDRKRSFIGGLGFGSSSSGTGDQEAVLGRRSFLSRGGGGAHLGHEAAAENSTSSSPSAQPAVVPQPRKASSGTKRLLRRAKSFGTSPVLGATKDGTFASPPPPSSTNPPTSPHLASSLAPPIPIPVSSTSYLASTEGTHFPFAPSTLSLDGSSRASPIPSSYSHSGASTPLTPHSPYYPPSRSSSSSAHASASASTMVLPEPVPSQPHWLFAPAPSHPPTARRSSEREREERARSSGEGVAGGRRRSADERPVSTGWSSNKGKERADGRSGSVPPAPAPKRKMRRATLGGLFGRRESKSAAAAAAEEARRSGEGAGPLGVEGAVVYDSPTGSPALGAFTSSGGPGDEGDGDEGTIPSLPSLPSLQLSQNPYRMSWAFAHGSPASSPEKTRTTRADSNASRGSRPSLSIATTPVSSSPANVSPIDENLLVAPSPASAAVSSRPALGSAQSMPLPPPLQPTKSTDSAATLLIRNPHPVLSAGSPTSPSSTATVSSLSRAGLSASTPPLRRANSYAPSSSSSPRLPSSTSPIVPSPLSSPSKEPPDPLGASSSSTASPSASASMSSPSLARTLIQTRAARSHSDASDRRSPASPPLTSPYMGGRGMVVGGMGIPPGGGVFAGAGLKVGQARPATSEGTTSRSSMFGSLGSFFSSSSATSVGAAHEQRDRAASHSMSRSSSAQTAASSSMPAASPGLGATSAAAAGEVSEFGALFDGGGGGDRRGSSALVRPGSGRKRGLSVGAGIGSFFGGGGSGNSLSASAQNSPSKVLVQQQQQQQQQLSGRARSGSASSSGTHGSAGQPLDLAASSASGGRMRALTDPNRRFSLASFGSGSGSGSGGLAPPGAAGGRPSTADGAVGGGGGGTRSRGNSVTSGSPASAAPAFARAAPKVRKAPPARVDEGETPEEYVRRLLEGEKGSVRRRASRVDTDEDGGAQEVIEDADDAEEKKRGLDPTEEEDGGHEPLPRGEVTRVLASSSEPFHLAALQAYLRLFPFENLALDIALRAFLSSASLPSETQQIDRVMEAFARRYCECNPGLFGAAPKKREVGDEGLSTEAGTSDDGRSGLGPRRDVQEESDIPYVLSFSMVMLNTDQFNPNAKSKMTKADYVKNTRIDGVPSEILEYLYDQITAAPFVYVNDDEPSFSPSASSASLLGGSLGPSASSGTPSNSGFFGSTPSKNRLDPYHLIATGQTHRFKVDVESLIPTKSPFSYTGTTGFFDATKLHALFARAPVLQISNRPRSSSKSQASQITAVAPYSPSPGASSSALPAHLAGAPLAPTVSNGTFVDPPKKKDRPPVSTLKITKVGLLSRKDDLTEGGKKAASRKWRGWSVVLTGSQLLFFKDPHFAGSLQRALQAAAAAVEPRADDHEVLVYSWQSSFKPDAVLSLAHSAAIYDSTYSKYSNVFRLVAPGGRQYLFQAHDVAELNSWLHAINYAAAFKTAGLRIRATLQHPPSLSSSQRTTPAPASPRYSAFASVSLAKSANGHPDLPPAPSRLVRSEALGSLASSVGSMSAKGSLAAEDEDLTIGPSTASGGHGDALVLPVSLQQALAANGANGSSAPDDDDVPLAELATPRPPDRPFTSPSTPTLPARADLLRARIKQLDAEIRTAKEALHADLRFAKHLAVLTPFRHMTRERILAALPPIEKRVRHARIQLAKLVCYREVLSRDLLVEDREAERLLRKQSLHRSHSRRTSSHHRPQRSPPVPSPHAPLSPHATIKASSRSSALSRPTTSLHPDSAAQTSDADYHLARSSFESTADSFSNVASDAHPLSLTDDELDRLQARAPPPLMQRSKTETDWASVPVPLAPLERLSLGGDGGVQGADGQGGLGGAESEDELEVREGGAETPVKRRSFALPSPVKGPVVPHRAAGSPDALVPPALEQRHSH